MISLFQFIITFLALVIIFISFSPLCRMEGGFKNFCHKMKYLFAMISGLVMIFSASNKYGMFVVLIFQLTIFLFIWPRIVWWIKSKPEFAYLLEMLKK